MKKDEFLKAFEELSTEDRTAVLAALLEKQEPEACCSEAEMGDLKGMMARMKASKNMASMCQEMMRMCQEKMASCCA